MIISNVQLHSRCPGDTSKICGGGGANFVMKIGRLTKSVPYHSPLQMLKLCILNKQAKQKVAGKSILFQIVLTYKCTKRFKIKSKVLHGNEGNMRSMRALNLN